MNEIFGVDVLNPADLHRRYSEEQEIVHTRILHYSIQM